MAKKQLIWTEYCDDYAKKHGIEYKKALTEARPSYYKAKGVPMPKTKPPRKPKAPKVDVPEVKVPEVKVPEVKVPEVAESLEVKPKKQRKPRQPAPKKKKTIQVEIETSSEEEISL